VNYKVAVKYGAEGTSNLDVSNVADIQFFNEAHYFFDESGEIIFIVPQSSVVFIKKY